MRIYDILCKKRDGERLTPAEIMLFVRGLSDGSVSDEQAAALLMAICIRGMDAEETAVLTEEMVASGDVLDLSSLGGATVDKHSTGGVGDKTTMVVGPVVASLGGVVAKLSGRGLGHTGGTLDKLAAIPGFNYTLSQQAFLQQAQTIGICVAGQTATLAPADKKLYALRDVTATVESVPLIAASVMSKKIAAGAANIVLDVKCGSGAFMQTQQAALELAQCMVDIGNYHGRNMRAVLSNMDAPLGRAVGNALEIIEAVELLQGRGEPRLRELCVLLSAHMLSLSLQVPYADAEEQVRQALANATAYNKFCEMVAAQGGDTAILEEPKRLLQGEGGTPILAPKTGYIARIDALKAGMASVLLGAGRTKKEDSIDPVAGLWLHKLPGDYVEKGEPLAQLYPAKAKKLRDAEHMLLAGVAIKDAPPTPVPLVFAVL